ncbi:MAG: pyridoxamine kinase [Lachnospiraceae bacterium]
MQKHQKKIALINDFTGYGRCSVAVSLPIISHMKVQCCPVPTAIFSNHMGFSSYYRSDYTEHMVDYVNQWEQLGLAFDGIVSGYLGSVKQIQIVADFIGTFKKADTKVIIDPVMADHGKLYASFDEEMCIEMKKLVKHADILTPNITECFILTDTPYQEVVSLPILEEMARKLCDMGAKNIIITGIDMGQFIGNAVYDRNGDISIIKRKRVGVERGGTGDIFASIVAADCVNGVALVDSVRKATKFIQTCIAVTDEFDTPRTDGVCFEEVLYQLK